MRGEGREGKDGSDRGRERKGGRGKERKGGRRGRRFTLLQRNMLSETYTTSISLGIVKGLSSKFNVPGTSGFCTTEGDG